MTAFNDIFHGSFSDFKKVNLKYGVVLFLNTFRIPVLGFIFTRIPSGIIQIKPLRGFRLCTIFLLTKRLQLRISKIGNKSHIKSVIKSLHDL